MSYRKQLSLRVRSLRSSSVFAVAALTIVSTSTLLVAQVVGDEAAEIPSEEVDLERRDERPLRIREEERDMLEQLNDRQEEIGEHIGRQREAAADAGLDIPFEVMKERAEQELFQAVGGEDGVESGGGTGIPGEIALPTDMAAPQRVCFRTDGSVTSNREECDFDQGRHFGIQEGVDGELETVGSAGDGLGHVPPSDEILQEKLGERFESTEPAFTGEDLVAVVSEALERLSAMIPNMQSNPAAMVKIQETITFLSGILRQYSAGQQPPADIRGQIGAHLEEIMNAVDTSGSPGGPGGFMPPDMSLIMDKMEKMISKLPRVIEIFEEEGIPVAPEARAAAEEAVSTFNTLKGPCADGDMNSCKQLGDVMNGIDQRMRPPMEKAMMEANKPEVGMRIHELMSEGMEDMGMPPGGMREEYDYPSNNMYDRGPPPGFDPSRYEPGEHFDRPPSGYDIPPEYRY